MRHFTWYTVNVWACRSKYENENDEEYSDIWCSKRAFNTFRTLELGESICSITWIGSSTTNRPETRRLSAKSQRLTVSRLKNETKRNVSPSFQAKTTNILINIWENTTTKLIMFICKTTLQNPYSATLSKLILFLINYNRVESHPVGIESGVNNKLFQIYIFLSVNQSLPFASKKVWWGRTQNQIVIVRWCKWFP